ncbi:disease resistance protein RUN1 isoform X2 [Cryptomeria japonica]|uniref:disease resistance protein RUN1 isoform X2 n=1 Tax=Cryptomeria japonica TaxID=3369 RepID=UPI0027DA3B63|nr:disease resistance protein RUN1 isoform X2 [Cryptomeria japonica]
MDGFKPYIPAAAEVSVNDQRYHVFLSFRGKDVRKTLVDHLFQALSAARLIVFLDTHKLKRGEIIDLSLKSAIQSSAIRIPIFSKGYAGSAWCLREASFMLDSPGLIIPLFYEVEPTHVRYPLGESSPYQKSFEKYYSHPDRYSREEIDGWKDSLEQICSRSGWSLDMTGGFEAQLVKVLVNDIIKTLDRVPLEVAKYPVGLENLKNDLLQKLHLSSVETVVKIGIWGIGGVGKTTLAKAAYNVAFDCFEAATLVFNVRDTSLTKLQGQILKDLVNYEGELLSVEKGKSLLRDRLRGIRALVILDDVDDRLQLDALAGDWLALGSRLIITSRDRHILNAAHISFENILEISGLGKSEGLQLFSWHAFLRPSPIPGYEELSNRIVEACNGHPLSLEIIGAVLYDKQNNTDIECWNETVDNITANRDIFKTLYISYSGLTTEEKEIFLDIACFFIGERTTSPIAFWKSMYKNVRISISNLSMKLLIKVDEKGVFDMHDLVRDMGRIIAEEEHTRQWQLTQSSSSFNKVSNISSLHLCKGDSRCLTNLCTPSLRYLHLEQVHIENSIDSLAPSLIWLKVESCSFPGTMYSSNLFKDLTYQLRIMDWTDCRYLQNLPDNIGRLSHLQFLNLSECQKLECLPNTISNLSQLVYLNLSYCEKLRCLPDGIGNLSQLEYLKLTCCKILTELPDSIGKLSQLKQLSLSWCTKLESLPETINNLSKLERLDMLSCYSAWKSIPHAILIKPTLCLLGLPPKVENWRKTLIEEGCLREQQITLSLSLRDPMSEFRAILAPECQKLKSKLTEIRFFPGKGFSRNRSRVQFKLADKTTIRNKRFFRNRSRIQRKLPGKATEASNKLEIIII